MTATARGEAAVEITRHSDAVLAARAATGDGTALGDLYDRYAANLFSAAYRLLMSKPEAEDVVHDVFVGLPEALRRYEERGALGAWLKRVTVRVALSRLRSHEAHALAELDATPATPARDHDAAIDIERALATLPTGFRAVLVLKEVEGYSHAEIADVLGISVAASKVRLHRALRALRTMLEEGKR